MATMCRKIIVQTGNIIDMEDQIRLVGQSTSEELKGCVKTALSQWVPSPHEDRDTVVVRGNRKPLLYSGMRGVSTTVKIFLSENSSDYVRDAIETVLNNVDRDVIDCVIVAPPDVSDDVSLSDVMETWRALEVAVSEGLVRHVGIADASNRLFKELYDWAQVKPTTIQINLSNCCDVSEEMRVFARAHDVQILTHSDDADMLDEDVVTSILSCVGAPQVPCSVQWLARHRTIQTCFGLILDKGYTIAIDCTEGGD